MKKLIRSQGAFAALLFGATAGVAACTDVLPTAANQPTQNGSVRTTRTVACTASVAERTVSCGSDGLAASVRGPSNTLLGRQNVQVKLTSSNVSYNSGTGIFQFDVTVQNLLNEAIGTPDGTVADPDGLQVFFQSGPTVTGGSGSISVANANGTGTFTASGQPYFSYNEILSTGEVSAAKTWQLSVPSSVSTFDFVVSIETDVQYLLVINEVMANSANVLMSEINGEWVELYNAGSLPVQLQNLVIADSAASGRRPYHLISSSVVVQPGGYVTLGTNSNTAENGGAPIDYVYGGALALANSLDAFKIARVFGTDTLTIDRTQYASASTSAQDAISRELKNPSLDNSNMDGSNWADPLVTSVFGTGGRGTPKAQNSQFTPIAIAAAAMLWKYVRSRGSPA